MPNIRAPTCFHLQSEIACHILSRYADIACSHPPPLPYCGGVAAAALLEAGGVCDEHAVAAAALTVELVLTNHAVGLTLQAAAAAAAAAAAKR